MPQEKIREEIRATIVAAHPGVFNFDRMQLATIIGLSTGYIANLESAKKPLIRPVHAGKKPQYQLIDIVNFLVSQREANEKKRCGPRTKQEKIDGRVGVPN